MYVYLFMGSGFRVTGFRGLGFRPQDLLTLKPSTLNLASSTTGPQKVQNL